MPPAGADIAQSLLMFVGIESPQTLRDGCGRLDRGMCSAE
jgi:hypothetical protein